MYQISVNSDSKFQSEAFFNDTKGDKTSTVSSLGKQWPKNRSILEAPFSRNYLFSLVHVWPSKCNVGTFKKLNVVLCYVPKVFPKERK